MLRGPTTDDTISHPTLRNRKCGKFPGLKACVFLRILRLFLGPALGSESHGVPVGTFHEQDGNSHRPITNQHPGYRLFM